ncbi:MAG: hypothetical protein ACOY46_09290 [Bacillota bacterium]
MKKYKTRLILAVAVLIIALAGTGLVYAKNYRAEVQKAKQLTQITRLDTGTILRLYKAAGDWDLLTKNIVVYEGILSLVEGTPAEKKFYQLIPNYEAKDLYVAFDYFMGNSLPVNRITEVLDKRAKGEDWDIILARCGITPEYKNYRVLQEDEIRGLLAQGLLPEDIVRADSIARARDLTLQNMLKLKTTENTWDDVVASVGAKKESRRNMKLSVPQIGEVDSPSALLSAGSQRAGESRQEAREKVKADLGLTDKQMEVYLSQGLNPWEVKNAYRLSRANGVGVEEILNKKRSGQSWEEILAAYPKK